ncbi:hypothetical protein HGI47_02990 [Novosphingobium sp. ERN07]|uniref:hypothetical protein n=1 Tax=Novosphingobium sp. ERN07 TaxID=2726187 RepID=UPI0014564DBC|nr:hypothetical protein [Novosphingobium sp. ERN07]NLR69843.1 hypothetical protein [Novosphingobium sp. ERN07]
MSDTATADTTLKYDGSSPPLLANTPYDLITRTSVVRDASQTRQIVMPFQPWVALELSGGRPILIPANPYSAFLGITLGDGRQILNADHTLQPYVNHDAPSLLVWDVTETYCWHQVEKATGYTDTMKASMQETFVTSTSSMSEFSKTVDRSVSATASASGFGFSAEVTGSLSDSITHGITTQSQIENEIQKATEVSYEGGYTYTRWHKVLEVTITPKETPAGNGWYPLSQEQMAAVLPAPMTCRILVSDFPDKCLTANLVK